MKRLLVKLCLVGLTISSLPAFALNAYDDFRTDVTSGWGSTRTGNSWTIYDPSSIGTYSVSDDVGKISLSGTNAHTHARTSFSALDAEGSVAVNIKDTPTAGYLEAGVTLRHAIVGSGALTAYRAVARFEDDATRLLLRKYVNGTVTAIGTTHLMGAAEADEQFVVKFSTISSNPTKLYAKIWPKNGSEPSAWQIAEEDSESALQTNNGGAGISALTDTYYSGSGDVEFDNFFVADTVASYATNLENLTSFYSDELATSISTTSTSGATNTTYDLSNITTGTPQYLHADSTCSVVSTSDHAISKVYFLDDQSTVLYTHVGCKTNANFYNSTDVIKIPVNTAEIKVEAYVSGGSGEATTDVDILGKLN